MKFITNFFSGYGVFSLLLIFFGLTTPLVSAYTSEQEVMEQIRTLVAIEVMIYQNLDALEQNLRELSDDVAHNKSRYEERGTTFYDISVLVNQFNQLKQRTYQVGEHSFYEIALGMSGLIAIEAEALTTGGVEEDETGDRGILGKQLDIETRAMGRVIALLMVHVHDVKNGQFKSDGMLSSLATSHLHTSLKEASTLTVTVIEEVRVRQDQLQNEIMDLSVKVSQLAYKPL